jgi:predicted ABC-type transport system involved in lysophospholipase L1 biosynthesis ATPase subunit
VTHDAMIAKRCTRTLQMLDGTIVEDRRNEEE